MNFKRSSVCMFVIPLALTFVLTGCSESSNETTESSHQTVDWYVAHKAERDVKLKWCNNDMARAVTIDCLNAAKADQIGMMSGPSTADTFKFDVNKTLQDAEKEKEVK